MLHKRTWLLYEMATILEASPTTPTTILAFTATRSMQLSTWGDVNTCCHPVESLRLEQINSCDCNIGRWLHLHSRRSGITVLHCIVQYPRKLLINHSALANWGSPFLQLHLSRHYNENVNAFTTIHLWWTGRFADKIVNVEFNCELN